MPNRPNILFLMSDEHRPDVTGYEGNDVVRTPTLDRLAEGGVVFRNAYTPSPICIPARQCMMAGQLPMTCGCQRFGSDLPPFSMTFARRFAQYAYVASCHGKLHHTGRDQMQGWTQRGSGDTSLADWAVDGLIDEEVKRYPPEPGTGKWSNQKEIERASIGGGHHVRRDARATQSAVNFIENHFVSPMYDRPGRHRPLLLKHSLVQPHYPFFTDEAKFNYYMNRVPIFTDERFDHPVLRRSQNMDRVQATPRDIRRATAGYYGMVETIDEHYASVLDALRHVGEDLDDWIIVYASDHGEMLGEHGVWEKTRFFEASVRVPLIIRWPRRFKHRVVEENVNLCDLFATLCDLAGIDLPDREQTVNGAALDSRSLVPLMTGDAAEWRERYHNESVSETAGKHLMIKRDALKYQWYGDDGPEVLFDLATDPGETRNVIDDPACADRVAELRRRRAELGHGPDARNYTNAGYA